MGIVAIVPMRGGSKGIPNKNLQLIGRRTLAEITVMHGLELDVRVVVSTDSDDIAFVANKCGAEVVRRPEVLAGDYASSDAVISHTVTELDLLDDTILFMQATSPFKSADRLREAIDLVCNDEADVAFSAVSSHSFAWRLDDQLGSYIPINHPFSLRPRRQDLAPQATETGSFYAFGSRGFMHSKYRFFGRVKPVFTSSVEALDIDTFEDLEMCRAFESYGMGGLGGERA